MSIENLLNTNVNSHTEKKGHLTYLSWAWAWAEALKADPKAGYKVEMFDGKCYMDINGTFMVWVTVTIFGKPMTCQLPVMNHLNKAIQKPDAFQVNTAIMRCMTKALSLHGLGLYIYAGEDLPENEEPTPDNPKDKPKAPIIPASPKTAELSISAERLAIIQLCAENIKEHFAKGNIIDAYGEKIGITDSDESIALNNLLPSNIRTALRNHHQSLKRA
jgi:hypothetical protein